jgi:hypothetical protein
MNFTEAGTVTFSAKVKLNASAPSSVTGFPPMLSGITTSSSSPV